MDSGSPSATYSNKGRETMNLNVSESISAFESGVDDLGPYYAPDEILPKCRRHQLDLVYHLGYYYCPRCRIKVYDSMER